MALLAVHPGTKAGAPADFVSRRGKLVAQTGGTSFEPRAESHRT
jgi:hypothetical protein